QDEIECLGIEASPSFVREPEGNGVAERFIRTLKENLLWVRTFDTIEELRAALVESATRYNETWLVARHGYRTPGCFLGALYRAWRRVDAVTDGCTSNCPTAGRASDYGRRGQSKRELRPISKRVAPRR